MLYYLSLIDMYLNTLCLELSIDMGAAYKDGTSADVNTAGQVYRHTTMERILT